MEQVVNRLCKHLDDRGPVFQSAKLIFTGLGNQCYTFCPLVLSNLLSDLSIKKKIFLTCFFKITGRMNRAKMNE